MNTVGRFILVTTLLLGASLTTYAQIPNPGFENWTNNNPDGWFTSYIVYKNVVRCDTAHSGSYSAKGFVVNSITGTNGMFLNPGTYGSGCAAPAGLKAISGYLQFHPEGGDRLRVQSGAVSGHASGVVGTPIGAGIVTFPSAMDSWTRFSLPITYAYDGTPNWATMEFLIVQPETGGPLHAGTYFLVDDLSFDEATAVDESSPGVANSFKLGNNYPNPFNPSTTISFTIPTESHVSLEVFNVLGQRIAVLENENIHPGTYQRSWDGNAASGVYFYRLHAVGVNDPSIRFTEMKKMILMR